MEMVKVLTSEVKAGDWFEAGNNSFTAISDSYINPKNGAWSVDLHGGYIFGWGSQPKEIEVKRATDTDTDAPVWEAGETDKNFLLEELRDIAPSDKYNVSLEETLDEMPQFLVSYLAEMKKAMMGKYPHRAEIIGKSYEHLIADMTSESDWLI